MYPAKLKSTSCSSSLSVRRQCLFLVYDQNRTTES